MESKEDLDLARERELADSVTKRKHTIAFLEATLQEQRSLCASEEQRIAFMQGKRAGRSVHAESKQKRRRLDPPPLSLSSLSAVPEDDAEADAHEAHEAHEESFQESLQAEAADADDDEDEPMVVGKSSRRPIRITDSESDSEQKEEHQPQVDDGDEKEPNEDADAGEEEHKAIVLLPDQEKRKAVQYAPGELVLVEWDTGNGKEEVDVAEILCMQPLPAAGSGNYPEATIRWIYATKHILGEGLTGAQLAERDFCDGDYAFSTTVQDVFVFNIVGKALNVTREEITFHFAVDAGAEGLTKLAQPGVCPPPAVDAEEEEDMDAEAEEDEVRLPVHLDKLLRFLTSRNLWDDTTQGKDWWTLLLRLKETGMGQSTTRTSTTLRSIFMSSENGLLVPQSVALTMQPLSGSFGCCRACGRSKWLTYQWAEEGWRLGKHCMGKIAAFARVCSDLANARREVLAPDVRVSVPQMERLHAKLQSARDVAMEAIDGRSF